MKFFTYGTFMVNQTRHMMLADQMLLNEGFINPLCSLYRTEEAPHGFPVALTSQDSYPIKGELYEIKDSLLPLLDHIESNGRLYERQEFLVWNEHYERIALAIAYLGISHIWQAQNLLECSIQTQPFKHYDFKRDYIETAKKIQ